MFTPDLCRTGLAGYAEILRIGRFPRSAVFPHNAFEAGLNVAERLVFAHLFAQNHYGKIFHHLVVASDLGDKTRLHELSAVGHTVVEGQSRDRRNLGFVADAHPRERCAIPSAGIVAFVANARHAVAGNGNVQVFHDADALQPFHKLVGIASIGAVYEATHSHIGRAFDNFRHRHHTVSPFSPVRIAHLAAIDVFHARSGVVGGVHRDFSVVHRHHERHRFEHRSRFHHVSHGTRFNFCV